MWLIKGEIKMAKNVKVIKQSSTGRNLTFKDGNKEMTRSEFVKEIKRGEYDDYYVKKVNGVDTPVSKPDSSKGNNLG